jgi:glycerol-3-phosphate dehydrogenase
MSGQYVHYLGDDQMNIQKLKNKIKKDISYDIDISIQNNALKLEGVVENWEQVIKAGKIAAMSDFDGVINNLKFINQEKENFINTDLKDNKLNNKKYDVIIIGAGIIGCSIARELSKWNIKILVIDKENDIALHTSSRNDGMIHPGLSPKPGTKKAYYNVLGNKLYEKKSKELNFEFKRTGSLIVFDKWHLKFISPFIKLRAKKNGVYLKYVDKKQINMIEPNIDKNLIGGFLIPSTGIISPYKTTIAYAENAVENGVDISFETFLKDVYKENNEVVYIETNRGRIFTKCLINCAGVHSDEVAEIVGDRFYTIHPRKGEIIILDKKTGNFINSVVSKTDFNLKNNSKGGGIIKTVEENLLLGPNAYEQPYKEDYSTTSKGINEIMNKHSSVLKQINKKDIITYFSGTRASTYKEDFIIKQSSKISNFIHVSGIQSPGIASAPSISEDVEKITINILKSKTNINQNIKYNPNRKGYPILYLLEDKEKNRIINKNPDFGKIVCRCEMISYGEIKSVIHSNIPAITLDAIKRRTRVGMGRCQGGFCTPLLLKIIHEETGIEYEKILKKGLGSNLIFKETKKFGDDFIERI